MGTLSQNGYGEYMCFTSIFIMDAMPTGWHEGWGGGKVEVGWKAGGGGAIGSIMYLAPKQLR